jgi:hypothetical protein
MEDERKLSLIISTRTYALFVAGPKGGTHRHNNYYTTGETLCYD